MLIWGNVRWRFGEMKIAVDNLNVDHALTVNGSLIVWGGSATLNQGITQPNPGPNGVAIAVMGPGTGPYNLTIDQGANQTGVIYVPQGTLTLNKGVTLSGSLIAQQLALYSTIQVTYNAGLLPPSFPTHPTVHLVS